MAIFTACRPALCEAALRRFNLWELFGHIVYAEEIGLEKRNPQCFVRLSELLGVPSEQCILFDDSPDNCAAAGKAGMKAAGVYDAYYAARQDELKAVCGQYIRSFEDLCEHGRYDPMRGEGPGGVPAGLAKGDGGPGPGIQPHPARHPRRLGGRRVL